MQPLPLNSLLREVLVCILPSLPPMSDNVDPFLLWQDDFARFHPSMLDTFDDAI